MKKYILAVTIAAGISGIALAVPAPKVTICHATSSEGNPWTRIVVSENAIGGHFDNPGTPKAGHEDDVLLQGDVPCPVVIIPEDPTDPTDPTDPEVPVVTPNPLPPSTQPNLAVPSTLPAVGADGF